MVSGGWAEYIGGGFVLLLMAEPNLSPFTHGSPLIAFVYQTDSIMQQLLGGGRDSALTTRQ